jgi:hypothetical protein
MEPDEIRAEVERRKQVARDLKIREVLWDLEKHFRQYRASCNDPKFAARLIYPGVVVSEKEVRFTIEEATFQLTYKPGVVSRDDDFHSRRGRPEDHSEFETARGTLALNVNGEKVFKFNVEKTTEWTYFGPIYHDENLGEVTRFIEGAWVTEVAEFRQKIKTQFERVWKERNAPGEAKEAEALRKRFGI